MKSVSCKKICFISTAFLLLIFSLFTVDRLDFIVNDKVNASSNIQLVLDTPSIVLDQKLKAQSEIIGSIIGDTSSSYYVYGLSDDTSVAVPDAGRYLDGSMFNLPVTGKKAGKTTVTIYIKDININEIVGSADVSIEVRNLSASKASITLSQTSVTLAQGSTVEITAGLTSKIEYAGNYYCSLSTSGIAEVKWITSSTRLQIKGLKAGTVTCYVSIKDKATGALYGTKELKITVQNYYVLENFMQNGKIYVNEGETFTFPIAIYCANLESCKFNHEIIDESICSYTVDISTETYKKLKNKYNYDYISNGAYRPFEISLTGKKEGSTVLNMSFLDMTEKKLLAYASIEIEVIPKKQPAVTTTAKVTTPPVTTTTEKTTTVTTTPKTTATTTVTTTVSRDFSDSDASIVLSDTFLTLSCGDTVEISAGVTSKPQYSFLYYYKLSKSGIVEAKWLTSPTRLQIKALKSGTVTCYVSIKDKDTGILYGTEELLITVTDETAKVTTTAVTTTTKVTTTPVPEITSAPVSTTESTEIPKIKILTDTKSVSLDLNLNPQTEITGYVSGDVSSDYFVYGYSYDESIAETDDGDFLYSDSFSVNVTGLNPGKTKIMICILDTRTEELVAVENIDVEVYESPSETEQSLALINCCVEKNNDKSAVSGYYADDFTEGMFLVVTSDDEDVFLPEHYLLDGNEFYIYGSTGDSDSEYTSITIGVYDEDMNCISEDVFCIYVAEPYKYADTYYIPEEYLSDGRIIIREGETAEIPVIMYSGIYGLAELSSEVTDRDICSYLCDFDTEDYDFSDSDYVTAVKISITGEKEGTAQINLAFTASEYSTEIISFACLNIEVIPEYEPEITTTPEVTTTAAVTTTPEVTTTAAVTTTPEVTTTATVTITPEVTTTAAVTTTPEVTTTAAVTTTPEATTTTEMTTTAAVTTTPTESSDDKPSKEKSPGDVTGDGKITVADAINLNRYIAGGWTVTVNLTNADVNGDGRITVADVILLRRYIAGGWNVQLN